MILSSDAIKELARSSYSGVEEESEVLFCLLVDVADVYLASIERKMPTDSPESPFLGGLMPIEALVEGLRDNLELRQDNGLRLENLL